ncbi:MAG TPA: GTP-binding protein [Acidimicrobiales bacterium]|nr:GTP-binding protein [Acidimicrobiales bacterium]
MPDAPGTGAQSAPGSELLRFAAVGSVDDGKSTLIGRLLHDTKQLFEDQIEAISTASRRRGIDGVDLSFVTDGLRAEREQGITIDVAYRYAATPGHKFIIADCPGHVQYTRNMATGASTADLVVVVVDATGGLREQTRRHCCIAALLGVRHMVVAANKMDLAGWDHAAYESVARSMAEVAGALGMESLAVVPVSALMGDNVAVHSPHSPWYHGPTVLEALEGAAAGAWAHEGGGGPRLPVQWVVRQPGGGRRYAGMVSGGTLRVGDHVVVLPSGTRSRITAIGTFDGPLSEATPSLSVSVELEDELDVSRGDLIAPVEGAPEPSRQLTATVCWFSASPLEVGGRYKVKHTTRTTSAEVLAVEARLDVATLALVPADTLDDNEIGVVSLALATPLAADPYRLSRVTGSFVVIDESTNATVAAGMVGPPVLSVVGA